MSGVSSRVCVVVVLVFNVPPTAKVTNVYEVGQRHKVSSDRLVKPWTKPANPGLQGEAVYPLQHGGSSSMVANLYGIFCAGRKIV